MAVSWPWPVFNWRADFEVVHADRTTRRNSHKGTWRAQEDLNPRTRIRSPLLYPG